MNRTAVRLGASILSTVALLSGAVPWIHPPLAAIAQTVQPAPDGTGTIAEWNGTRWVITGGQRSPDGNNLFHSFERFHIESGQGATFLVTPELRNAFARVVGGEASYTKSGF